MIIGDHRDQVINNIADHAQQGLFNEKVEIDDPQMTSAESLDIINQFWQDQTHWRARFDNLIARTTMRGITDWFNHDTTFCGLENLKPLSPTQGAVITSNHFNQLNNTVIRKLAQKNHRRLFIVIQETNLKMGGLIGFLMNHLDVLPLAKNVNYLGRTLPQKIAQQTRHGHWVLIYPEQEMWFNYRKPRPVKRGAYYYAARANAPIISCFTEIIDLPKAEKNNDDFYQTRYRLHVLPLIWPDPQLSVNENAKLMMEKDYAQKKAAYEKAYQKKLDYRFTLHDIAGWRG